MEAALLEHVSHDQKLNCEEAFGPVAILESFSDFSEALRLVNQSRYGLQAGVFTNSLQKAYQAWDRLEVGGVIINDVPSWRADNMPYGGMKESGFGREGPRYAIREMTDEKTITIRTT